MSPISLKETVLYMKKIISGNTPGSDGIRVEQYQSDSAVKDLHRALKLATQNEDIPEDMVLRKIINFYKKRDKDDRGNCLALGLINHV